MQPKVEIIVGEVGLVQEEINTFSQLNGPFDHFFVSFEIDAVNSYTRVMVAMIQYEKSVVS